MNEFTSKELRNATEVPSSITALPVAPKVATLDVIEHIKYKLGQISPQLVKHFERGFLNYNDDSNANKIIIQILNSLKQIYTDTLNKDDDNYGKHNTIIELTFTTLIKGIEILDQLGVQPNTVSVQALIAGNIFRNL